ncbi:MAG: helix-turn-helix transcriptional regulator [Planctomycetes bacterium]|nr:helix-turn-helix transcriptional regulator [Planctomycetota bacterium]
MMDLQANLVKTGVDFRPAGFDSGWTAFPNTLVAQILGGYRLETRGRPVVEIPPGGGFLLPSGMARRVRPLPGRTATTIYAHIHFRIFGIIDPFALLDRPILLPMRLAGRVGRINRAFARLRPDAHRPLLTAAAELALGARLLELLLKACPDLEQQWRDPRLIRLLPALRHIEERLADGINRRLLAATTGLSVARFHAHFQAAMGMSPMAFVATQRLLRARRLLADTPLGIAEIAARCGYQDAFYFSRAFRRSEGVPPSVYRHKAASQGHQD